MRRVLPILLAVSLAACASYDDEGVTVEGVDPVQTDPDLAPDTYVQPGGADLAPDSALAPDARLEPTDSLQPDLDPTVR